MKLFGIHIDLKAAATTAATIAVTALVTHRSVKAVAIDAARAEIGKLATPKPGS
jgi:hypothetical protein